MKIIVPIDGSNQSYEIVPFAVELAKRYGDEIIFLNIQQNLQELGLPAVKKAAELVKDEGVAYSAKVRTGIAAMEIVAESSNANIRYIVMAKGKGGEEAIGSVSAHVLKLATCPVVFVPKCAIEAKNRKSQ